MRVRGCGGAPVWGCAGVGVRRFGGASVRRVEDLRSWMGGALAVQWRVCSSASRRSHIVFSQLEISPLSPHTRHPQRIALDSGTM